MFFVQSSAVPVLRLWNVLKENGGTNVWNLRSCIQSCEIFKIFHSKFDICRNFQRIKMKFYILIISKKSHLNFSLSCSFFFVLLVIIVSLQDLS